MITDAHSFARQQPAQRYLSLIDCAPYNLPISPEDEDAIAKRWAHASCLADLKMAIQRARQEARLSAIQARGLGAPHQRAERATTVRHMLNERRRCRIAIKAMRIAGQYPKPGASVITPDALLRSIEAVGWVTMDARGAMRGEPTQTVSMDFMTAVGPKSATITALQSPLTGDIHFRCCYMSEGRNTLETLAPTVQVGSSFRGAHATLRDLLVAIDRVVSNSYAAKLLRNQAFAPAPARKQIPEASTNGTAPKRMKGAVG